MRGLSGHQPKEHGAYVGDTRGYITNKEDEKELPPSYASKCAWRSAKKAILGKFWGRQNAKILVKKSKGFNHTLSKAKACPTTLRRGPKL